MSEPVVVEVGEVWRETYTDDDSGRKRVNVRDYMVVGVDLVEDDDGRMLTEFVWLSLPYDGCGGKCVETVDWRTVRKGAQEWTRPRWNNAWPVQGWVRLR